MYKKDFPYFNNSKIVYLDNAATTQKPKSVIDSQVQYYENYCANTHRSNFGDANKATLNFENARKTLKEFINASTNEEIIFTKGVTESINFVANSFVKNFKTVIISSLEHHSNIVPWHMMDRKPGAGLEVVKYKENLEFDLEHYETLLQKNPNSFVSVTHVSNAFGVIHPVKEIVELAHKYGAKVLIDGAQAISRFRLDMKELKPDFYVFSGHKCYGPTGIGVLYVDQESLKELQPYQTGGAVIEKVTFNETTLLESPQKYEAGTQNIAGVIGLGAAIDYMAHIGYKAIDREETLLLDIIYKRLSSIKDIKLYTTNKNVVGNISFNIKGILPLDLGLLLDKQGIAVRSGHHCAMPIMQALKIDGTVRISLGIYNDLNDIDNFFKALNRAIEIIKD